MLFMKDFFEKFDFEKNNPQTTKKQEKFPRGQRLTLKCAYFGPRIYNFTRAFFFVSSLYRYICQFDLIVSL